MSLTKVKKGDIIYNMNRYPHAVYFIIKGRVNCKDSSDINFKNYV